MQGQRCHFNAMLSHRTALLSRVSTKWLLNTSRSKVVHPTTSTTSSSSSSTCTAGAKPSHQGSAEIMLLLHTMQYDLRTTPCESSLRWKYQDQFSLHFSVTIQAGLVEKKARSQGHSINVLISVHCHFTGRFSQIPRAVALVLCAYLIKVHSGMINWQPFARDLSVIIRY